MRKFTKITHKDLVQFNWYKYALKGFTEKQKLSYGRNVRYYSQLVVATPTWADLDSVFDVFLLAAKIRNWGKNVEVDHIIPINHPYVCGLHCVDNLQIMCARLNNAKSNVHWPDMWGDAEQLTLF